MAIELTVSPDLAAILRIGVLTCDMMASPCARFAGGVETWRWVA
jgi:hypothetical protein